jgi:hypothetical protein
LLFLFFLLFLERCFFRWCLVLSLEVSLSLDVSLSLEGSSPPPGGVAIGEAEASPPEIALGDSAIASALAFALLVEEVAVEEEARFMPLTARWTTVNILTL